MFVCVRERNSKTSADMNLILLSSLLCLACSVLISLASSATHSSEMGHVTVISASGEGLQSALGEEPESEDGFSGLLTGPSQGKGRGGRKKHGGKKRNKSQVSTKQRNSTPAQNLTSNHAHSASHSSTSSNSHTPDPCKTTHKGYCIHGYCTNLHDLKEPVCVCMKGYDGERCGIQLLQTGSGSVRRDGLQEDTLHITLITITVVLSVISCSALLLIICLHYRAQHSFQAALLSVSDESEKLQKNNSAV